MIVQIFIVTFRRDVEFLRYALRSIEKFTTGFAGTTVLVPEHDRDVFRWVKEYATLAIYEEDPDKGFLHHASQILHADQWCPKADAILCLDSDCVFWESASPADYIIGGRPVLYREPFDGIKNRIRNNWRMAVRMATGLNPAFETMVRHPSVYLPKTLHLARYYIERYTDRLTENYILSCRNSFPQSFAEHPTIGAVALHDHPLDYHWIDYRTDTPDGGYKYESPRDKICAAWTHDARGIERYRETFEEILAGNVKSFSAAEVV